MFLLIRRRRDRLNVDAEREARDAHANFGLSRLRAVVGGLTELLACLVHERRKHRARVSGERDPVILKQRT